MTERIEYPCQAVDDIHKGDYCIFDTKTSQVSLMMMDDETVRCPVKTKENAENFFHREVIGYVDRNWLPNFNYCWNGAVRACVLPDIWKTPRGNSLHPIEANVRVRVTKEPNKITIEFIGG